LVGIRDIKNKKEEIVGVYIASGVVRALYVYGNRYLHAYRGQCAMCYPDFYLMRFFLSLGTWLERKLAKLCEIAGEACNSQLDLNAQLHFTSKSFTSEEKNFIFL